MSEQPATRSHHDTDDQLRSKHYSVFVALGLPIMLSFAAYNVVTGHHVVALAVVTSCLGLFVGWLLMRAGVRQVLVFRSNAFFFAGIVLFVTYDGGIGGSQVLWAYCFPLIAHFLLSRREGLVWSVAHYVLTTLIVLDLLPGLQAYEYPPSFATRFLVTLFIVATVSYWFEYFRVENRRAMEAKHEMLQDALAQVQTLRGLLPICTECKKIRDDDHHWVNVEDYIHERSDADFSHGICPQCAGRLYPDLTDPPSSPPPSS